MSPGRVVVVKPLFLLTVFLSAFLLFQVQPLISKTILPWFGGSPAVWTTCMLFFQVVLSAGYVYAHLLASKLSGRAQGLLHAALLIAAVCTLPVTPDAGWKPDVGDNPVPSILLLLTMTVGLPYFALSATGPLLQSWFTRAVPGKIPYRLYALSNAGSLLALLSYPFLFEPLLTTGTQGSVWSWGFVAFALVCAGCGLIVARRPEPVGSDSETDAGPASRPTAIDILLWFALAAVPSSMLLATTNQVYADIAVVPFLWILPLSLYLLTFILCFDSDRWYSRRVFSVALVVSVAASFFLRLDSAMLTNIVVSLTPQAAGYLGLLFCCCMVCHGELVRLRPHPKYLTMFYLAMSFGGAAGGLFVGLAAPNLFQTLAELPLAMLATCALLLVVMARDPSSSLHRSRAMPQLLVCAAGLCLLAGGFYYQASLQTRFAIAMTRNFYGTLRVIGYPGSVVLKHGQIRHGHQFRDGNRRRQPTAYYSHESGIGLVLHQHQAGEARNVGVIGLGAGTLATYAQPEDHWRFYEINPDVVTLARDHFTYLSESEGDCEIITADGRIALEREESQQFDVLVLDAFSGDAVPAHLLTHECGEVYMQHLAHDGILAVHITNRHLDLRPVCRGIAEAFDLNIRCTYSKERRKDGINMAMWILMSRSEEALTSLQSVSTWTISAGDRTVLWTDQWTNLLSVIEDKGAVIEVLDRGTAEQASSTDQPTPDAT